MKTYIYILFIISIFTACGNKNVQENTTINNEVKNPENTVALTNEQIKAIGLQTDNIKKRNLLTEIRANGYLDIPPQNSAMISPMITGYVSKLNFLVGDMVKKGQIMAELESMEYIDMQQQFIELSSRIKYLEDDYNRQKLLQGQDAVSRKTFLLAEADYKTTLSMLDGLKSKLKLLGSDIETLNQGEIADRLLIRSPIGGAVRAVHVSLGEHADPSEVIYEVINTEHIHLELSVYEQDAAKVQKGQKVWFSISSLPGKQFEGEVFLVGQNLSESKRAINVHVHFDERSGPFTVGMYASATINVGEMETYTLPVTAVVTDQQKQYVFKKKITAGETVGFERVQILAGQEKNGQVEILNFDSFVPDDEIVTRGTLYLLNAISMGESL